MMRVLCVLLTILMTACATTNSPTASKTGAGAGTGTGTGTGTGSGAKTTTGLSGRLLEDGDCGLFVWTADTQRRFILFAQSEKKSAVWDSPQGEQSLAITSQEGRPMQDQYPVQRYDHSNMTLSLSGPEAITDGTRYKTGTLSTITGEGWEKIIPVHGLSACKRASNALSG